MNSKQVQDCSRLVIDNMPVCGLSRQRDDTTQDAGFEEPDSVLTGYRVFPYQVGLAVSVEIRGSGDVPAGRLSR